MRPALAQGMLTNSKLARAYGGFAPIARLPASAAQAARVMSAAGMGLVEPPLHVAALAEIAIRPDLSASTVVEVLTRSAARRGLFIRFRSAGLSHTS